MHRREKKTGNYFLLPTCTFAEMGNIRGARETMVYLIEEIHSLKGYREQTFYLAVAIADRYLKEVAVRGLSAPKIVPLGMVALLLAAKVNESMIPNFKNMVYLINIRQRNLLSLEDLIGLEREILTRLDFGIHLETPDNFLDRYSQLFHLDRGLFTGHAIPSEHQRVALEVASLSRYLCRFALRSAEFLDFLPSQIAAAAFMLSLNSIKSEKLTDCGLFELSDSDDLSMLESEESEALSLLHTGDRSLCLLGRWTNKISELTFLQRGDHIKTAYCKLVLYLKGQGI